MSLWTQLENGRFSPKRKKQCAMIVWPLGLGVVWNWNWGFCQFHYTFKLVVFKIEMSGESSDVVKWVNWPREIVWSLKHINCTEQTCRHLISRLILIFEMPLRKITTIMGKDLYWMNFLGLMILTLIEVAAVGLDLSPETTGWSYTEKELTLFILKVGNR